MVRSRSPDTVVADPARLRPIAVKVRAISLFSLINTPDPQVPAY